MNTKLRRYVVIDLTNAMLDRVTEVFERTDFYRSCISCNHFGEQTEICSLVGKRPPARIIASGCELYNDSGEVPF